ncbi:hypothetical protein T07_7575 [Trichinella nelsoni]|uniref:Uncharacterized protein n=1 Tax=Trichinella nelsoni TaxID=6336 RepID=A0A0V0RKY5_9BILA|nr:hypothetical protein T07_7575 [Trichinella nelsoni]
MSGGLLVSVTVAPSGSLQMALRAVRLDGPDRSHVTLIGR